MKTVKYLHFAISAETTFEGLTNVRTLISFRFTMCLSSCNVQSSSKCILEQTFERGQVSVLAARGEFGQKRKTLWPDLDLVG